ncbi:MAG: hypothetical protein U9N06_00350 [candidate division WOR-3 bacterium]|nr:hypothetical protein [candidate division WOR-3 bacterium]
MEEIKGQEIPKRILSSIVKRETIPSAFLFYGPPGVGKFSLSLQFASEIIGERNRVRKGVHPDLLAVFPEFDGYEKDKIIKIRKNKGYYKLRYSKGSISIDTVRKIQDYAYITPMESKWRVIIIVQAERMTLEASDAFLKILEEPPPNVLFILITPHYNLLTETIVSRTLNIRFCPLSPELQKGIIKDSSIQRFGRGIEETFILNLRKDLEEEIGEIFFNVPSKVRIKNWSEDLRDKWKIEFLLLYLQKLVEDKYKRGEITLDRAWKTFKYLKRAYEYYYSNLGPEEILFYLFLKI